MNNSNIKTMFQKYQNFKVSEQTKVREILQETALLGLERHGFFEKAAFYGGTALRILYGLDRFSEDLDFILLKPDLNFDFAPFLEGMKRELSSFGFNMEVMQKTKSIETSIVSAFTKMNTIQLLLAIGDEMKAKTVNHNEKIQIKLEIDIDPPAYPRVENRIVNNPIPFTILTLHPSDLFAGKMHAILYRAWKGRVKGRDWFDLTWYLRNKIPVSLKYLEACMWQAENLEKKERLDRDHILMLLDSKIKTIDWESAKNDMRQFVSDQRSIEIWSAPFFLNLIHHFLVE